MEWDSEQVSHWLIENGFEKYADKFKGMDRIIFSLNNLCSFTLEEEIDGLVLLHLSPSSIEELLSINTSDNVIKKPTIGIKTIFEKKLEELKDNFRLTNK